ncbi:MAG: O-antigen ligase family protein [Deltaproteobacteria bacterium]|nr:O-antigen ligase family protein [Deltaproteobacteria bacterium]MDL1960227.1 O-antigen ligase family protein [Deltaproteobacteria bacterium]
MNHVLSNRDVRYGLLGKLSIGTWVGILILTGTYFRIRSGESAPEVDWLITAQISVCLIAAILGILMMRRHVDLGFGTKALLLYVVASLLSAVFSPYTKLVFGYWILLAGASLLTIGLVQQVKTQKALSQIENVWLLTISLLLLKDTATALLFPEIQEIHHISGPFRLGMGITHANTMGFLAALAFWISFKKEELKHSFFLWLPRLLFLFIIALSGSRVSMVCFAFGGVIRLWFQQGIQRENLNLWVAIPCFVVAAVVFAILALSLELPGATTAFNIFNRGQDIDTIMSLTKRTEIWSYAFRKVFDEPASLFFGHGYGISRLVLNEGSGGPDFYISHLHNSFIEIFFSLGLFGIVTFLALVIYSIKWLTQFNQLHKDLSTEFTLRAVSIVSMILLNSFMEITLASKIDPVMLLYFFYLVALDRRHYLKIVDQGWT